MRISIVSTLYNSAQNIEEFYNRISTVAKAITENSYEIILVNDGSPDNSLDIAVNISKKDNHVVIVDLSRNFGHHKAIMTGLSYAKGETVFLIDSDLEEAPEWIVDFKAQKDEEQCDVVYGVQDLRKGGIFERLSGNLFWTTFNFLTNLDVSKNITTARLMSRRYVDSLLLHQESEVFLAGLWHITGFNQSPRIIKKGNAGVSSYTFRKKISLLTNLVTAFSNAPLVYIFYLGAIISSVSAAYIVYLLVQWAFLATPASGWTSVMASIWLLGGLIMLSLGVLGIYLSKIFSETKKRPYTIVKHVFRGTEE